MLLLELSLFQAPAASGQFAQLHCARSDARSEVGTEGAELHQLIQGDAQELELVSGVHCLPGDSGGAVGGVGGALEEDQQLGHTLLSS